MWLLPPCSIHLPSWLLLLSLAAVSNSAHKHLYAHRIRRIRVYFTCHDRDVLQRHNNGTWQS